MLARTDHLRHRGETRFECQSKQCQLASAGLCWPRAPFSRSSPPSPSSRLLTRGRSTPTARTGSTRSTGCAPRSASTPCSSTVELTSLAQGWSEHMAATGTLSHTPDMSAEVSSDWTKLGENVGYGPSNDLIWNGFLNSPKHYANLTDPAFTHVGIGVTWVGGTEWVTHRFMGGGGSGGGGFLRSASATGARSTIEPTGHHPTGARPDARPGRDTPRPAPAGRGHGSCRRGARRAARRRDLAATTALFPARARRPKLGDMSAIETRRADAGVRQRRGRRPRDVHARHR